MPHTMDEGYFDGDGKPVRLGKLCRQEPDWAANVIGHSKERIDALEAALEQARAENARLKTEAKLQAIDAFEDESAKSKIETKQTSGPDTP